jgi:hypothetical protein
MVLREKNGATAKLLPRPVARMGEVASAALHVAIMNRARVDILRASGKGAVNIIR